MLSERNEHYLKGEMMKKRYMFVFSLLTTGFVLIFLLVSCATYVADNPSDEKSAYEPKLVCNLNTGTLNGLQLGAATSRSKINNAIGKRPTKFRTIKADLEFFEYDTNFRDYLKDGMGVFTQRERGKEIIIQFKIYTMSMEDIDEQYYHKFPGRFVPSLSSHESVASIRQKFGTCKPSTFRDSKGLVTSTQLEYKRPYGKLMFWFDESGLGRIDLIHIPPR